MKSDRVLAIAAFIVVCIVWGTTYLAIRVAIETIPPVLLTGARFTFAGVLLLAIMLARGERIPRDPRVLGHILIVGLLLIGVGNLAVVWAERWVPSGMAALLVATAPFWATIIEALRPKGERLELLRVIGMVIGFLGVALLVTPHGAGSTFGPGFLLGALAIQIGCFSWQLGSVHGKYNLSGVKPLMSATLEMLFAGIVLDIIGFAIGEGPRFHVNTRTFIALAYLAVFGSIIAYSAYIYALSKLRTTTMSLYSYVNPVVAVILGWLILNEQLTGVSIVAMIVIMAGMALVQTAAYRKRPHLVAANDIDQRDAA